MSFFTSPVRTKAFLQQAITPGIPVTFGPGVGFVWVIEFITAYYGSQLLPSSSHWQAPDGRTVLFTDNPTGVNGNYQSFGCKVVLTNTGGGGLDSLTIVTDQQFDVSVHGYELTLP